MLLLSVLLAQLDPNAPKPAIQIPGFEGFSKVTRDIGDATIVQVPYLAEYIAAVFKFAVGAGAVVAAFMIAVGGFQYIASAGIPANVMAAKKRIQNALVGFLLLLGSYVFLYSINPELVQLKSISLLSVQRIELEDSGNEEEHTTASDVAAFDASFNINSCPDLVTIDTAPVGWGPNAHRALRKDSALAFQTGMRAWITKYPSKPLTVNRDYRTRGEQQYLFDLSKNGGPAAATPGTSNHERGNALDISTAALSTQEYTELLKIMEAQGFKVLGNGAYDSSNVPENWKTIDERWHFDYKKGGTVKVVECTGS